MLRLIEDGQKPVSSACLYTGATHDTKTHPQANADPLSIPEAIETDANLSARISAKVLGYITAVIEELQTNLSC